jgi:tyrosine-protein kinase Etk/Wzc
MMNSASQQPEQALVTNPLMKFPTGYAPPNFILEEDEGVSMTSFRDFFVDHWRMITAITLGVTLLGAGYALVAKPVYQATMMIHVEEENPSASKSLLGDMASLFDVKTATSSEIELISSRLVVARAVDNLHLNTSATPKYFPVIGAWLASRNDQLATPGILGYGGYAWGAEKIEVGQFTVPEALQGRDFVLTAESDGRFRLEQKEQRIALKGRAGTPLNVATDQGNLALRVDRLEAKPGAQFIVKSTPRLETIEKIQSSLAIAEKGKQSGIIGVTLEGHDPQMTSAILGQIGQEYLRQNASRKLEEAEKSLAFLDRQLPELKQQLEQSEAQYNQFRRSNGTIDLGEESKLSLQQSVAAQTKLVELRQKREELLSRFTQDHPAVIAVKMQIRDINNELGQIGQRIKQLPMLEQDVLRLNRDVKVNTELYAGLLNTAQQLRLIKAGKVSNVRLVDMPMAPDKPVRPKPLIILLGALLGGLLLGLVSAILKKTLNSGIDDPHEIGKMLGHRVVHVPIPHSKKQEELHKLLGGGSRTIPVLAKVAPDDAAIESLRSFRSALQISMAQAKNNIVVITGPTPGMGKSFVSVNLAALMAATGKRVLLIDADFRHGHLHQYFDIRRQNGLSDAISGTAAAPQAIHRSVLENVDFMPTGELPPNPAEFLLNPNFSTLLNTLSASYDLVLIDTPPVLAVADTLIIGTHAGTIFLLTRAGESTASEINESIKRLNQAGIAPKGVLFNGLKLRPGRYGYGYQV